MKHKDKKAFEIRDNPDGSHDEIVACHPRLLHLEQMDEDAWWMGIEMKDGSYFHVNFNSDTPIRLMIEAEGVIKKHGCCFCTETCHCGHVLPCDVHP